MPASDPKPVKAGPDIAAMLDGRARIRPPFDLRRVRLLIIGVALLLLFVHAMNAVGFTPRAFEGRGAAVLSLWNRMWPPSFVDRSRYVTAVLETVWMVIAGTSLALIASVPIAVLAARNTTTGRFAYAFSRGVITGTRAVPSLVFALVFVRAIGIGPLAGVLAMAINSIGMVGKFFSDRIEEVDQGLIEAARASGASRTQVFISAILPQVLTNWISLALYRIDINVRSAVIFGYVGAGGIGFELQRVQGQLVYRRVLAIALIVFVMVVITEQLSGLARRAVMGRAETAPNPFSLRARYEAARRQRFDADTVGAHDARMADERRRLAEKDRVEMLAGTRRVAVGWDRDRGARWSLGGVSLVAILGSFWLLGFGPLRLVRAIAEIGPFIVRMFPPDFVTNFGRHLELMAETVWMALAATVLGLLLSLPIGILGARNATLSPVLARVSRFLTVVVRGIPELILAVLLVVAVGLGPFAGVLALTIGSIGLAGKLIADAIEDTDLTRQQEALRAVGASWLQMTFSSTIPSAIPSIIGVGLYSFDVYVRAATLLGIVGAGGIGLALDSSIRGRVLDQTLAIIILIFVTVYATERLAGWLRSQFL